jgi:hypothetical protein
LKSWTKRGVAQVEVGVKKTFTEEEKTGLVRSSAPKKSVTGFDSQLPPYLPAPPAHMTHPCADEPKHGRGESLQGGPLPQHRHHHQHGRQQQHVEQTKVAEE